MVFENAVVNITFNYSGNLITAIDGLNTSTGARDHLLSNNNFYFNQSSFNLHFYNPCTEFIINGGSWTELIANYEDQAANNYCTECIIIPILLLCCLIAMLVNVFVIASSYWIQCPSKTPNLKISLSLAAADAFSSTLYGLLVLIEDYITIRLGVFPYIVELLRLSGIVITVVHLLALSLNHYIGILKPLHYNSIVTSKKVAALIWLLWICPTLILIIMCMAFDREGTLWQNFLHNTDTNPRFMHTFSFRLTFCSLFFLPIFIMVVCYTHILIVVRKQQTRWKNLSRMGSTKTKGKSNPKLSKEKKQLEGNVRAIYTTLFILGSCFIGWTPAILFYTLACQYGCYIEGNGLNRLNCNHRNLVVILRMMDNVLIISKMLANPIIYSIRMKEIKDGIHRMIESFLKLLCPNRILNRNYYYDHHHHPHHHHRHLQRYQSSRLLHTNNSIGDTMQMRMTSLKSNDGRNHHSTLLVDKEGLDNTFL